MRHGFNFDVGDKQPQHTIHKSSHKFNSAVGYFKKPNKKYFTKTKEDKVKESPLLQVNRGSFISPWVYVGLDNRDRVGFVKTYVLSYLKTTIEELSKKTKKKEIVFKKKIFCYAMREYAKLTWEKIGDIVGLTHDNVLYHVKDVKGKLDIKDKDFTDAITDLNKVLKHD